MFKFTIRETILATATIAVLLAWWLDHREARARVTALESENVRWRFRAEFLQEQFNGTKIGGKWMLPWRVEFDPESEKVTMPGRVEGSMQWVAPEGTKIEWRTDWAAIR